MQLQVGTLRYIQMRGTCVDKLKASNKQRKRGVTLVLAS